MSSVPREIHTERLHLRCWRVEDAVRLLPILEANQQHLRNWIPQHVSSAVPLPQLKERLAGFAADFDADRSWRFGIFGADGLDVFGEVDLFPRSAEGRVQLADADRCEIGYWLRSDLTGRGYAVEAARAMIALARTFPQMAHVEIRCDARNTSSWKVAERLGFAIPDADYGDEMLWVLPLTV